MNTKPGESLLQTTVTLSYEAYQWNGSTESLPEGFYVVEPEIVWAASRQYLYFTWGTLQPKHWMGVDKAYSKEGSGEPCASFMEADKILYWRSALPFAIWDMKTEASVNARAGKPNAYAPVFIDWTNDQHVELLTDYILLEQWTGVLAKTHNNKLEMIEFREVHGGYGRGYMPHYLSKGDWLVHGPDPKSRSQSNLRWHVHKADEPWK